MKKVLETERLILRELNTGDAGFVLELLNTPAWIKFIGDRGVRTLDDAKNYIIQKFVSSYEANGFGLWLIELKDSGMSIGMCGLIKRNGLEDIDIGFALLPQYEGKGYGYESAAATLDIARNKGIERIVAITVKYNSNSIKLLEKIGLRFEKMISLPNDNEELMLFGTP